MQIDKDSAFPYVMLDDNYIEGSFSTGLTLRDYFAAKAMLGELNSQSESTGYYANYVELAKISYKISDAMLVAREA